VVNQELKVVELSTKMLPYSFELLNGGLHVFVWWWWCSTFLYM